MIYGCLVLLLTKQMTKQHGVANIQNIFFHNNESNNVWNIVNQDFKVFNQPY
jgi:hypothetical protein